MKKKKTIFLSMVLIMSMLIGGCAGCAGCNGNTLPSETTPTLTTEPTKEVTPTEALIPTQEATNTPVVEPTVVPAVTEEPTPTETPTPIPTNTPVPTPEEKPLATKQMGDNVWYDLYADTLVVRGTGATWNVDARFETKRDDGVYVRTVYEKSVFPTNSTIPVTKVIIMEGVTKIGDWALAGYLNTKQIDLPLSLKEIGYAAFYDTAVTGTKVVGFRNDLIVGTHAFGSFWMPMETDDAELAKYVVAPTPLPAPPKPTATPTPNPDKPRIVENKKMGDNVTYEFWDNGYLYVKGSGKIDNKSFTFNYGLDREYFKTLKTIIVEEGITCIGDFAMASAETIYLPKSLTSIGSGLGNFIEIHGYYNGKEYVMTREGEYTHISLDAVPRYFEYPNRVKTENIVITWDE